MDTLADLPPSPSPTPDPATPDVHPSATIITAVCLYLPFLLVGWFLFEGILWLINRNRARETLLTSCYLPRLGQRHSRGDVQKLAVQQRSYFPFGWIWPVLRVTDDEIFDSCGLDALTFLRLLRMGQKVSLFGIGLSIVLIPLYATAEHPLEQDRSKIDPLERITMSNLEQGEPRIWASVAAMYAMSFFAFYLFAEEYKVHIRRRHQFLGQLGAQQYSVLINDLPWKYRSSKNLVEYLQYLFPDAVQTVHVGMECAKLEKLVERRVRTRDKLEVALAHYSARHVRPTHRPGGQRTGGRSAPVDSIEYLETKLANLNRDVAAETQKLQELEARLAETQQQSATRSQSKSRARSDAETGDSAGGDTTQQKAVAEPMKEMKEVASTIVGLLTPGGDSSAMRPSAFVSFRSLKAVQSAQQLLQTDEPAEFQVWPAPAPEDIVWENYGQPHRLRESWLLISWLLTILIILFWTIPSSFIASLASVDSLKKLIPGLEEALKNEPWLGDLLKQLSPIGLLVMSMLAYHIFGFLSRREGHVSGNDVVVSHFSKLIYFQTFQIFFVSVIAGTVFDSLNEIINEPKLIVSLLGTNLPQKATTFMAYLILQTGLKLTLELLMFIPIVFAVLYKVCAPKSTRRQRESDWLGFIRAPTNGQGPFDQNPRLPHYFLALLLIFAFCAIAPLLTYFAGLLFLASDIIYRRQVLFVYDPTRGSTGAVWPELHNFLVGGLLLAQITFLGLVSLKVAPGPITMSTILPFTTIAYFFYARSRWVRIARNLPLNRACELDETRMNEEWSFLGRAYIQPALGESQPLLPQPEGGDLDMEPRDPNDLQLDLDLDNLDSVSSPPASTESENKGLISSSVSGPRPVVTKTEE